MVLAGPGNLHSRSSKQTSLLQLIVGCDGRLWVQTASLVHQLKQQARDGTISEVLQLPLVGWRVKTETRPILREKRDVIEDYGSGDDEYYDEQYDDDEYDDIDDKNVVKMETSTKLIVTTPTTSTTTESTTVSSTTTQVHPHRHHHGELKPIDNVEPEIEVVNKPPVYQEPSIAPNTTVVVEEALPETTLPLIPLTSSTEKPTTVERVTERTIANSTPSTSTTHSTVASSIPDAVTSGISITQPDKTLEYDDTYDDDYDDEYGEVETVVPDITGKKFAPTEVIEIDTEEPIVEVVRPKVPTTTTETPEVTSGAAVITDAETVAKESPTTLEETVPTTPTTPKVLIPITVVPTTMTTPSTTTTTARTTETEEETTFKQTTLRHIATTPKTTVTQSHFTESIEYEVKNFPPSIQNRLKRLPVTAGKMFSFVIPENTFTDMEDGNNLTLDFLTSDGQPIKNDSWCQFNARTKEIYGL